MMKMDVLLLNQKVQLFWFLYFQFEMHGSTSISF